MAYKYAYQGPEEGVAKAASTDLPISTKTAVMLANFVRHKSVERAERDLQGVLDKRVAVPFTRFSEGAGHKPGIGPGKYPQKGAKAFLTLVRSVKANAQDKGMGDDLTIISVTAQQGVRQPNYGRHRGRMNKSTHVEMVVRESEGAQKKPAKAEKEAPAEKSEDKAEQKPAKKESKPKSEDKPAKKESKPAKETSKAAKPKKTDKEVVEEKAGKKAPKDQQEEQKTAAQTDKPKKDQEEKK